MSVRSIITSFNGGEVSRRLEGRVDQPGIYDRALAEMYNFVPTVEGPAMKRPGFRYVKAAAASATWLSTFVPRASQAYVLEWLTSKVRFYTNDGQIEASPGVPYEVTVPYAAADAPRLSSVQSLDRLRIAHASYPPAALTRLTATTFSHAALSLASGPFKDQNSDTSITVTASATTGAGITLTASSAIFLAGHVGAQFLLEAKDFSDIPAWEVGIDAVVSGTTKVRSEGKVYLAASSGRTGSVQPTHNRGTEYDGIAGTGTDVNTKGPYGVKWTYLYDRFGIVTITAFTDTTHVTATVNRRLADSLVTVASHRWAHAAFSAVEGYPNLVTLWAGRQVFIKDRDVYGSVAGDYDNFAYFNDSGEFTPDMAFHRTLDSPDPALWVRPDKEGLLIGTAKGEQLITQVNPAEAVSGDNLRADPQSNWGSAEVWPLDIGTTLLFVQRGARKIREAEFRFETNRFVGTNIAIFARHISQSGLVQLAFQQEPEEMLWGVRADGLLIAHAHSSEQEVKGFARVAIANGAASALSAVAIPADDGSGDELWVLADYDGAKAVLRLGAWWEENADLDAAERLDQLKAAFFVDLGVSHTGSSVTVLNTGLDHLIGKQVRILADGGVCPVQTVQASNPKLTLPYAASDVHVGLGYQGRLTTLRLENRAVGTIQGLRKRIARLVARLIDTAALTVRGPKDDDRLIDRPGSATMDEPVPLYNGDTENKAVAGDYGRGAQTTLVSDDPLPCIVSMLMVQLEVEK